MLYTLIMNREIYRYEIQELSEFNPEAHKIFKDYYWIVDKENSILNYGGYSWQCDSQKTIVDIMQKEFYPDCKVMQLPIIYVSYGE